MFFWNPAYLTIRLLNSQLTNKPTSLTEMRWSFAPFFKNGNWRETEFNDAGPSKFLWQSLIVDSLQQVCKSHNSIFEVFSLEIQSPLFMTTRWLLTDVIELTVMWWSKQNTWRGWNQWLKGFSSRCRKCNELWDCELYSRTLCTCFVSTLQIISQWQALKLKLQAETSVCSSVYTRTYWNAQTVYRHLFTVFFFSWIHFISPEHRLNF